MRWALWLLKAPIDDYLAAVSVFLNRFRPGYLAMVAGALALSWWIYVPIHELSHVLGCLLGGGEVSRLEIAPIYGAALLQRVFPFVVVGSDYAGQLSGFDTHGSDLTYLLTDFLPFVLTILLGVPLLRSVRAGRGGPLRNSLALGIAIPVAYAPFISIVGDYYEMGSIVVTDLVAGAAPGFGVDRWRSDDLFKLISELDRSGSLAAGDVVGIAMSFLVGLILAFATYGLGRLWSRVLIS